MKEMSCFCMTLSSLWEQMVKAYKYMTGIFSVTHTSEQQASDRDEQSTKMDVSLLEEQYDYIKQKQKLQSHIIVFKTGENESVLSESMVNAVVINKNIRKSKSLTECVPVRKVRLELTSNGNLQDSSPWRTHLGIHRLAQASRPEVSHDLSYCKNGPCSFDNKRLIPKENGTLQHKELETVSEEPALDQLGSSSTLNSLSKEKSTNISGICQKSPSKSATSVIWTHQHISSTKCIPACNKLNFYPFPQKKTPRISEAARRLGLYVSQ
uniref:TBC1 domain-containing protein n=1 Tax=Apteryx owenii TaxID=8824 RepID=A0A8B9NYR3_APTOW